MADDEELAAMAATHGLSARGAAATRPPFSYLHAFFRAMSEPFDATERPDGYVNLAVAQNFLTVDAVQRRLMAGFASPQPASTAAYDNMKGSERLRTAMAVSAPRGPNTHARCVQKTTTTYLFPCLTLVPIPVPQAHMHRILAKGNHSVKVHPEQLCISAGCGAILDNLFMCITEPNDGVLIPAPYYPAFDNDLRVRNGTVAIPVLGDDAASLPTPKQLDDAVAAAKADGRTVKALLLTNPSNPLGVVYGESLLDAIIWGLTNGMHVVVDEVYASSVFHETLEPDTGKPLNPFVSAMTLETMLSETEAVAQTKLHVVYGLSKDFCASGYRVGVLRTRNEGVLKAMDNVAYFCTLPGPMQHAVADMLEDREW